MHTHTHTHTHTHAYLDEMKGTIRKLIIKNTIGARHGGTFL
jgi:hypothetical protein